MYPAGLPTVDVFVSVIRTGWKAYVEALHADEKLRTAKQLLEGFDLSLRQLEELATSNGSACILHVQVAVARERWHDLERYLQRFEPEIGSHDTASKSLKSSKKVTLAFGELNGKIERLCSQIALCILPTIPTVLVPIEHKVEKLSNDVLDLRKALIPPPPSSEHARDNHSDLSDNDTVHPPTSKPNIVPISCWRRKGGCFCRCHTSSRITPDRNRHLIVDLLDISSVFRKCNLESCDSRRYSLQVRFSASKYGLPLAFTASVEFNSLPRCNLTAERVCRFTSPGFTMLWELERKDLDYSERSRKVADIKRLLCSGEATFGDVDPRGDGWLDKILRNPWPLGFRHEQWELVTFLLASSPKRVRANPKLLHACAQWIGEGPHMFLLDTLLDFGLDPGAMDVCLFQEWPQSSSPGWLSEMFTPDPMFVEWMQTSLRKEPGYAACDVLSETVLTGSTSEFTQALAKARKAHNVLRTPPNVLGQTAVHLAVLFPMRLQNLLEAGADADAVDNGGSTPLMYAACYGQAESLLYLLPYIRHPMQTDHRNRRTFVDYAVRRNHIHVIDALVRHLRVQGRNKSAMIVLDRCLRYYFGSAVHIHDWDYRMLDHLFLLGADPDVRNGKSSLLHLAISSEEAQKIIDAGFTAVDSADEDGVTPLMKTLPMFDSYSIWQLLDRGANINSQDKSGWTALHHSVKHTSYCYPTTEYSNDWAFSQWVKMVSSFHLTLEYKYGLDFFTRDHCKCACSLGGCSPVTIALHQTVDELGVIIGPPTISRILVDLLCILENRVNSSLNSFLLDLVRYWRFNESGLEHICCYGKERSWPADSKVDESTTLKHSTFSESFPECIGEPASAKDEIIKELAKLFATLEMGALNKHNEAISRHEPLESLTTYDIDEKNDEFVEILHASTVPSLSKFETADQRAWLARSRRLVPGQGLRQRGSLDSYVDNALEILSKIEDSIHEFLRNAGVSAG